MGVLFGGLLLGVALLPGKAQEPVNTEFFERKIRPILAARCVSCHGPDIQQGNLRLDGVAALKKGGSRGAALPANGTLLKAVSYTNASLLMPPSGKLPAGEIALLEQWVKGGAPLPANSTQPPPKAGGSKKESFDLTKRRQHWAYKQVHRPLEPPMEKSGIDAFVLAKLQKSGLSMAPEADKRTLIRRVTFDLTGLPPKPDEITAFLSDKRPDAYEKLIDRLLASPTYGERWARHWLDLVRYAESMGHEIDFDIPEAFQYRDYVIRALNADVPYDKFLTEQLAGDLLPTPRYDKLTGRNESLTATGFVWLGEGKHSPVDIKQEQADRIDNQIDVIGKAFLGQTVACARCHDHKFDPIPTKDYYGLYAIFASSNENQPVISKKEIREPYEKHDALFQTAKNEREELIRSEVRRLRETVKASTATPELQKVLQGFRENEQPNDKQRGELLPSFEAAKRERLAALDKSLEELKKTYPPTPEFAHAMTEAAPRPGVVFKRGNPGSPGDPAPRHFLSCVAGETQTEFATGGRLELANAITDKNNPLTARVIANRIWGLHFGTGIVRTPSDFGRQGEKPTHPELLDWLAATLMEDGWSLRSEERRVGKECVL